MFKRGAVTDSSLYNHHNIAVEKDAPKAAHPKTLMLSTNKYEH